jgi:probable lipoprotein (TIGR04455 family)
MKKAVTACTLMSTALLLLACTSVRHRFLVEGYTKNPGLMIKRIVIISDVSPQNRELSGLLNAMTRDVIKTNRNYLVYGLLTTERDVAEACKTRDGVMRMRVDKAEVAGERVELEMTGELRRCSDHSLVWSASARSSGKSRNPSLENLVRSYIEEHGEQAVVFAAPAFNVIEDIVETMPNPVLTEEELIEKVELEN